MIITINITRSTNTGMKIELGKVILANDEKARISIWGLHAGSIHFLKAFRKINKTYRT